MGLKLNLLCAFLPVLVAALVLRLLVVTDILDPGLNSLEFFKKPLNLNHNKCQVLGLDLGLVSSEDVVKWKPKIFMYSAGDLNATFHSGGKKSVAGGMVVVDARNDKEIKVDKLRLNGYPEEARFQPHGIYYSSVTKRLYAINHGGDDNVGTRVELFDVAEESGTGLPELTWRMSIADNKYFPNMILNDVVEGANNEVYLTQWKLFGIPSNGLAHPSTLKEKGEDVLQQVSDMLALQEIGKAKVFRCVFDVDTRKTVECTVAATGFVHANGIGVSSDRKTIWVNDPAPKIVTAFSRNSDGTLVQQKKIKLIDAADNIEYDEETNKLWLGGIPKIWEFLNLPAPVSGSFLVVDPVTGDNTRVFGTDGSKLSQISACGFITGNRVICGSPFAKGVLVCDI